MVPVHPDNRPLLGIKWHNSVFLDTTLPSGLRSAPKIFSAVADTLLWSMHCNGVQHPLHHPNDFLFIGPAGNTSCANQLHTTLATCRTLGVPIAPEKVQGPAPILTFLGQLAFGSSTIDSSTRNFSFTIVFQFLIASHKQFREDSGGAEPPSFSIWL